MIYYTGDIHGSAKGIVAFAQHYELTESDIIVILGEVGANYYGNRRDRYCKDALAKIKPTVFCVHGNHERRPDTLAGYKQKEWNGGLVWYEDECALPGFVDSKNEEKTERNAGYLVVSHSGGGMLRQGTRKGIRRTPANRGMRAHRIVKSLDISEDVCHGLCP